MVRRASWIVALCAGAACGRIGFDANDAIDAIDAIAPVDPPPRYVNGTRLRAVVYPGTAQSVLSAWYDTELDVECIPQPARDGRVRCLPGFSTGTAFTDADCTAQVAIVSGPYALPQCNLPVGVAYDVGGTAVELGAASTGSLYTGGPGNCSPYPGSAQGYEIGAPIPDDRFVAFEEVVLRGSQRLAYVVLRSDDGAQQYAGTLHDTLREERCSVRRFEPENARCLPEHAGASPRYSDSGCTNPVYRALGDGPLLVSRELLCTTEIRMFERGPEWSGPFYDGSPGACTPDSGADRLYEPGAEIALDAFAALAVAAEPFDSRLERLVWRTDDGITVPHTINAWRDVARGQHCEPVVEETSMLLVCGPAWTFNQLPYWTTADCSSMAAGHAACRPESAAIHFPTVMTPPFTCDGPRMRIFASETPVTMPIWQQVGGTCTGSMQEVYSTSRLIPGSELPPLVRVRD